MDDIEHDVLLAALQAHGQNFLSSFGPLPTPGSQKMRHAVERSEERIEGQEDTNSLDGADETQWHGFGSTSDASMDDSSSENEDVYSIDISSEKEPEVVVFSSFAQSSQKPSKNLAKSFMSSKVSQLRQSSPTEQDPEDSDSGEDAEKQRSNLKNDKLLHKLVHTQLLSASLNPELNLKPAQRRKALEGRLLELAAGANLGQGESSVRQEERKKASKRVQAGLERKLDERKERALEEAKNLGNYHRSTKGLYGASSKRVNDRRQRLRGLKLGVGKFSKGVLKLSKEEIALGQGSKKHGKSKKKGGKSQR